MTKLKKEKKITRKEMLRLIEIRRYLQSLKGFPFDRYTEKEYKLKREVREILGA